MALLGFPVATGVALLLERWERVPDHSWPVTGPARACPMKFHTAVFDWVLLIAEAGLVKGERIGVDASTMEANAELRNIVRRDTGEGTGGCCKALGPGERYRDTHG